MRLMWSLLVVLLGFVTCIKSESHHDSCSETMEALQAQIDELVKQIESMKDVQRKMKSKCEFGIQLCYYCKAGNFY